MSPILGIDLGRQKGSALSPEIGANPTNIFADARSVSAVNRITCTDTKSEIIREEIGQNGLRSSSSISVTGNRMG